MKREFESFDEMTSSIKEGKKADRIQLIADIEEKLGYGAGHTKRWDGWETADIQALHDHLFPPSLAEYFGY